MHFAYGNRKASHPTANLTPRQNRSSITYHIKRRVRLRTLLSAGALIGLLYLITTWFFSPSKPRTSNANYYGTPFTKAHAGHPNVVIVTVLDMQRDEEYQEAIRKNRIDYAEKHGYTAFLPLSSDYDTGASPRTWAKIPALRDAMTKFAHTPYFFYLDDHTLIANPAITIEKHLTNGERIEKLAITDVPVVPPDSVIKTLKSVPGDYVDLLLTQDKEGLIVNSLLLRSGEWARYFLDTWFDPLYRSYNFQKAERHALEHIVQWHGTLLAKLALIPQDVLCSYTEKDKQLATNAGIYEAGKFIVSFADCDLPGRSCKDEIRPWIQKLHDLNL